jgi:hypothetical protein
MSAVLDSVSGQNVPNEHAPTILTLPKQLLTTKEAALYISLSAAFLERDRWAGATIPFIRIGNRAVRYRLSDLDAYIAQRVRTSTSDREG